MYKKPILGAFWPMYGQLLTTNSRYSREVGSKAMNESEYCAGDLKMDGKLASHIWLMLKAFWCSKARTKILAYLLILVAVVAITIFGQLRLNAWNRPFYDAIAQKNVQNFLIQLGVFCIIAGILLVLNVGQAWLTQAIKLKFRKGIVVDLLDEWLPRAHRLTHAGAIGANPDQTSLRWFIDNFAVIADWQATLLRIADFRAALIGLTQVEGTTGVRAPIAGIERQTRFLSLAIKSKPSRAAFRGEPLIE